MNLIVASPCVNPEMELESILSNYANIGFRKLEVFTTWVKSAVDYRRDPSDYVRLAEKYGMEFYSFHLPPITEDEEHSLNEAVSAAQFAEAIGAKIVLFKAKSRELYIRSAKRFLDATDDLRLTPVLQNHAGSPISGLDDFKEVLDGIADRRMKTLLEVGHFHAVGVSWREGAELLGDSIALIHIKDMAGRLSVPYGKGEVDLAGLFRHMKDKGYSGAYVVELEMRENKNILSDLADAYQYIRKINQSI